MIVKAELEPEHWLEIGFVLLAAGLLGMLTVVAAGSLSEAGQKRKKFREAPPQIGDVAPEKHRGILNVSVT